MISPSSTEEEPGVRVRRSEALEEARRRSRPRDIAREMFPSSVGSSQEPNPEELPRGRKNSVRTKITTVQLVPPTVWGQVSQQSVHASSKSPQRCWGSATEPSSFKGAQAQNPRIFSSAMKKHEGSKTPLFKSYCGEEAEQQCCSLKSPAEGTAPGCVSAPCVTDLGMSHSQS